MIGTDRRIVLLALAGAAAACSSDAEGPTGPGPSTPARVAAVAVTPAALTLRSGDTATLSVSLTDSAGNVLSGRAVTWSTSNTGIASITPAGLVTALAPGQAELTATSESHSGSAALQVLPPQLPDFATAAVDTAGELGDGLTIAPGPGGAVHALYYDRTTRRMKYAACSAACTSPASWTIGVFQPTAGNMMSIAAGASGRLHAAFYGPQGKDNLGYAICDAGCNTPAGWSVIRVDTAQYAGRSPRLLIGSDGALHVAYETNGGLAYATCATECSLTWNWQRAVLVPPATASVMAPQLALGPGGSVHITFFEDNAGSINYATCASSCTDAANWRQAQAVPPGRPGFRHGLAVDGSGRVTVAWQDGQASDAMVALCPGDCAAASRWQSTAVDTSSFAGAHPALIVDAAGAIHMVYGFSNPATREVRYARCIAGCNVAANWQVKAVDSSVNAIGWFNGIMLGPGSEPRIAYVDVTRNDVRWAQPH